jgi:hypothetical protein
VIARFLRGYYQTNLFNIKDLELEWLVSAKALAEGTKITNQKIIII